MLAIRESEHSGIVNRFDGFMPVELFCLAADSLSPAHGIERAAVPTKRLHVTGITLGLGCYAAADIGVTGGQQSFKRIRDTRKESPWHTVHPK